MPGSGLDLSEEGLILDVEIIEVDRANRTRRVAPIFCSVAWSAAECSSAGGSRGVSLGTDSIASHKGLHCFNGWTHVTARLNRTFVADCSSTLRAMLATCSTLSSHAHPLARMSYNLLEACCVICR
jgi:hypothetical protein